LKAEKCFENSIFKLVTYAFIKSSLTIAKIQRSLYMLDYRSEKAIEIIKRIVFRAGRG
jgi:hypothetical protein